MMRHRGRRMRLLGAVAGAALLVAAGTSTGASAAPLTFTWNPGATVPPLVGGLIGPANNFNVSDFADIPIAGANFTENGYLVILNFLSGGSPAPQVGLGTTYSLYFGFNGSGTGVAIPGSGSSNTGPFTSLNYTLYASPNPDPTIGVSPGSVTIAGNAGAFPIAYGTMVSGVFTLTNTGAGFSPTANIIDTFHVCTAAGQGNPAGFGQALCTNNESGFFVIPPPSSLNLVFGNFSATTTVTTLTGSNLDINGGGGNLTLASQVPEPMSLVLLGAGFLGLGGLTRMRLIKRER